MLFTDYLKSTNLVPVLNGWAIHILLAFAIGFFIKGYQVRKARHEQRVRDYSGGPFWRGIVISAMNVLNIPFIFALASFQVGHDILPDVYLAKCSVRSPGVAVGVDGGLLRLRPRGGLDQSTREYITRNIFFFVSGLLAFLAILQGVRMY